MTWVVTEATFMTIAKLFQGVVSIKTLGGPLMIGQLTGQAAQESLGLLVQLVALVSVNLGVLNLLPVPILDGGLIIFLLLELVLGKPISIKKRETAQKVGICLLAILIVVVMHNDLSRLGTLEWLYKQFARIFG
jgi:regulator of sigma E protease